MKNQHHQQNWGGGGKAKVVRDFNLKAANAGNFACFLAQVFYVIALFYDWTKTKVKQLLRMSGGIKNKPDNTSYVRKVYTI